MITILENPAVLRDITILRNKNTATEEFRNALNRISTHLAVELSRYIKLVEHPVETPLEVTTGYKFAHNVILVPVLRAGLGLVDSFMRIMPESKIGYIGLRRNEKTFKPEEYYYSIPDIRENDLIIILEVMLATGGSVAETITRLQLDGARNIVVCSIISAPEGIEYLRTEFPNIPLVTAQLDRELNAVKYILPGLGDAGDRYTGH